MAKKKVNPRRRGHNGERHYMNVFKEMGYKRCSTSRSSSRQLDDCGVDLNGIPFNIQIKTGIHKGLNPLKSIIEYKRRLQDVYEDEPHRLGYPFFLIHRKMGTPGKRRTPFNDIVYIQLEDFLSLAYGIETKFDHSGQNLCKFTFEEFKSYLIKQNAESK